MVEGLLEINLILTNLLLFYIVVHCYQFKGNSSAFITELTNRSDSISIEVQEALAILTDIADTLDESGGVQSIPMGSTQPSMDLPSMLLSAFMAKTNMGDSNGPRKEESVGEIQQEELIPPKE